MNFDEYQQRAATTAIYPPERALEYLALGLTSEAGEVASIVKKAIRDNENGLLEPKDYDKMFKELGDVLWYLAMLCHELRCELSDVAAVNADKLRDRKERNVIAGSGDVR